jgi:hypothetical protein
MSIDVADFFTQMTPIPQITQIAVARWPAFGRPTNERDGTKRESADKE